MPEVNEKFRALYKRDWNKGDVDEMYASFEKHLFASLKDFTTPIPGVLETMAMLCEQGINIGSTTGYTAKMMEIVRPGAEAKGYRVDNLVTPNEVPAGRPAPYMIYKNMPFLQIILNLPLLIPGFVVKWLFFVRKGFGKEYANGIFNGIAMSDKEKKVPFQKRHLWNYVRIQMQLWVNVVRRFVM